MFYLVWTCSMNIIWKHYIRSVICHCHVTYQDQLRCNTVIKIISHGCGPLYAHFRIMLEAVGHPGTFVLLFYEYYELNSSL